MKGDIIECNNCGKTFVDSTKEAGNTYQWKGQDSREGKFKNMCPFCYGTNTRNTHEKAGKKTKFIYKGDHKNAGANKKMSRVVPKPNLETEHLALKVLGQRKSCDITEERKDFAPSFQRTLPQAEMDKSELVEKSGGTFDTSPVKSFTPIELMERKLKAQYKLRLSPPDNREKYKEWRYGYTRNYNKRLRK